jgi:hypothetical protein
MSFGDDIILHRKLLDYKAGDKSVLNKDNILSFVMLLDMQICCAVVVKNILRNYCYVSYFL